MRSGVMDADDPDAAAASLTQGETDVAPAVMFPLSRACKEALCAAVTAKQEELPLLLRKL